MDNKDEIKRILIPVDFSDTSMLALDHAVNLAKIENAKVYLLHVLTAGSYNTMLSGLFSDGSDTKIKDAVSSKLNSIANDYKSKSGIEFEIVLSEGKVASQVVDIAHDLEVDIIVMGTHGVSGVEEFFIGSNAYRVVTSAMCPVLTVQSHAKTLGFKKILLPLDSSKNTRDKVSQAAKLAKSFDATIAIKMLITSNHEDEKNIFNLKLKQTQDFLDHHGIKHTSEFINGDDIADMTIEAANKEKADLIIILTEQEASTGLFMGKYAQRIVNHAKIPILAVTPMGIVQSFSQENLGGSYKPFGL